MGPRYPATPRTINIFGLKYQSKSPKITAIERKFTALDYHSEQFKSSCVKRTNVSELCKHQFHVDACCLFYTNLWPKQNDKMYPFHDPDRRKAVTMLADNKPLHIPVLIYYQLEQWTFLESSGNCCLQNICHFVKICPQYSETYL